MATHTSIINSVLKRLREDTVAGPSTSAYATLIGELVNEAKRDVEDAWKWRALQTTITVTTVVGQAQYSITGSGDRFKEQAPGLAAYNIDKESQLRLANAAWIRKNRRVQDANSQSAYYFYDGVDANGDTTVNFYQTPDAIESIEFDLIVPQANFSLGTEVLTVPEWPVVLGAYAKAVSERGEDNGRMYGEAIQNFNLALSDAIAIDEARQVGETTWTVV